MQTLNPAHLRHFREALANLARGFAQNPQQPQEESVAANCQPEARPSAIDWQLAFFETMPLVIASEPSAEPPAKRSAEPGFASAAFFRKLPWNGGGQTGDRVESAPLVLTRGEALSRQASTPLTSAAYFQILPWNGGMQVEENGEPLALVSAGIKRGGAPIVATSPPSDSAAYFRALPWLGAIQSALPDETIAGVAAGTYSEEALPARASASFFRGLPWSGRGTRASGGEESIASSNVSPAGKWSISTERLTPNSARYFRSLPWLGGATQTRRVRISSSAEYFRSLPWCRQARTPIETTREYLPTANNDGAEIAIDCHAGAAKTSELYFRSLPWGDGSDLKLGKDARYSMPANIIQAATRSALGTAAYAVRGQRAQQ
jgi:hypothetical protein